ncbi:hypothetical protein V2J09_000521 [Rumex salicifolius]
MDIENQNQEKEVQQNLRKQLAVAVRSIQWSYSIFWSISPSEPRVLEWGEGYYNGDIKTRKTMEAVELDVDQMSLKRSEQLREFYESLLAAETNPQSKRPSAALIPEDLSDTEWYYLVCMSFVFNLGQGLPGRAFRNGRPMWLCNAHRMDSRLFSRSLLAKTVVCFPFSGGVVELGTTDLVLEDHSLILSMEASLLDSGCPALSQLPISVIPNNFDTFLDNALTPFAQGAEFRLLESPPDCSFGLMLPEDEAEFMTEDVDDELSHCLYTYMTSNDCISQNHAYPEDPISVSRTEDEGLIHSQEHDKTEGSCLMKMEPDIQGHSIDDVHYKNILGSIFKTKCELIWEPPLHHRNKRSCFVSWKRGGLGSYQNLRYGSTQKILKKILFGFARTRGASSSEQKADDDRKWSPESDNLVTNNVLAERKRRECMNNRFCTLKSLIPSIDKDDKVSILDDTIKYMKVLERRLEELEACRVNLNECCAGKKPQDAAERTSDNYKSNKNGVKRKASEVDLEDSLVSLRDSSTNTNISISLIQNDVSIEITCPHKQCVLIEIIDALANLRLDTHSVQSSVSDDYLSVTIKAMIKGFGGLSAGMIRQVVQRVISRSTG